MSRHLARRVGAWSRRGVDGPRRASSPRRVRAMPAQAWWLLACFAFVVAYFTSLILVERPASGYTPSWDGWVANIALVLPIAPVWVAGAT